MRISIYLEQADNGSWMVTGFDNEAGNRTEEVSFFTRSAALGYARELIRYYQNLGFQAELIRS